MTIPFRHSLAPFLLLLLTGCAAGPAGPTDGLLGGGLLGPAVRDAYGPAVHRDATGRPFEWRTQDGETERGSVQPDAYGPGVGMDAYGRPVLAVPLGE